MRLAAALTAVLLAVAASPSARAAERAQDASGVVADFRLPDHRGGVQQLYRYADRKAVVLIVHGNGCPIVQRSVPKLLELRRRFGPREVAFLLIDANPQDDAASVAKEAAAFGVEFPIAMDSSQDVARALDITRTAEAFVLDPKTWRIAYRGAIDDGLHYGAEKPVTRRYLEDALAAVVAGKKPAVDRTEAFGCLIRINKKKT